MDADLLNPIFTDEDAARAHFETLRWEDGVPVCFHCGVIGDAVAVRRDEERAAKKKKHPDPKKRKVQREGLYYCRSCGGQFTATMGTVYEDSHIPLNKWMLATHLMNASKKGMSALQLKRMLGFGSYRTAWFMAHRIREAMGVDMRGNPLGGTGKVVEADETYYGKVKHPRKVKKDGTPFRADRKTGLKGINYGTANKRIVVALVERGGPARTFHVANADKETVARIVVENVHPASRLHTDESHLYKGADAHAATHETVNHGREEYARGDVTTNTVEGFFAVFKRGMTGVYQHCDEKYLARYLREFEFRYNNRSALGVEDKERAARAVKGAIGKRLTLRPPQRDTAPA